MSKQCHHCGLPSFAEDFCCSGCELAFRLIREGGLDAFYDYADLSKRKVNPQSLDSLRIFDHPDFLKEFTSKSSAEEREGTFDIQNLYCTACIWLLEKLPQISELCLEARINYSQSKIFLRWKDGPHNLSRLALRLEQLGYPLSPTPKEQKEYRRNEIIRIGITGALAAASMHIGLYFLGAWKDGMDPNLARFYGFISALITIPLLTYSGETFFKNSVAAFKLRSLHPDMLIVFALLIAFGFSLFQTFNGGIEVYYDSIGMVIFFLILGRFLIRELHLKKSDLFSWKAKKIAKTGQVETVPTHSLQRGDLLLVESNEALPVDARLRTKEAWIDLSVHTGESEPQKILQGQEIPQTAVNTGYDIEVEVLRVARDSHQAQLLSKLQMGSTSVLPSRWEQAFTVLIFILSLVALLSIDTEKAIAILIVACPCALSLSVPLAQQALRSQALRRGLFLCRVDRLNNWEQIDSVFFDKTGTLTESRLDVLGEKKRGDFTTKDRQALHHLARSNQHPVSRAIAEHLSLEAVDQGEGYPQVQEVVGKGVFLRLENLVYFFGGDNDGRTVFKKDDDVLSEFHLSSRAKHDVRPALEKIRKLGYRIGLLTGDRRQAAERFVADLNISFDEVEAEKTPDEKEAFLSQKQAMVGDGLNDALAFKRAGFSIGLTGSAESNLQVADLYLIRKDLSLIGDFITAWRQAKKRIFANYAVSLLYNSVAITLVILGGIGPILCAIFMPLSSMSVILISHTGSFFKKNKE